jgi:hypothetical protein
MPETAPLLPAEEDVPEPVAPLPVPFTSQAPFGEWSDPFFQNACEEASLLMAAHWLSGEPIASREAAKEEMRSIARFEDKAFGQHIDTSAADTDRILREHYGAASSQVRYDFSLDELRRMALEGKIAIVPMDGRKLGNPNYTPPGPPVHMLVIVGYDGEKKEFVTNDPGTRRGEGYRYDESVLFAAIRDYPTGAHTHGADVSVKNPRKAMIAVSRP